MFLLLKPVFQGGISAHAGTFDGNKRTETA